MRRSRVVRGDGATSQNKLAELCRNSGVEERHAMAGEESMGRYLLLWLIGVPIPVLLLIWAFGGLH